MKKGEAARRTHPFTLAVAVVLAVGVVAAIMYWRDVREYYLYFNDPRPALSFDFQDISDKWGEAELKSYFEGADLYCLDNTEPSLGNRRCYLDINAYNGAPAMGIGFFLDEGRVQYASINVPIWAHGTMHDTMTKRHGPSSVYSGPISAEPLDIWRLPGGSALFMSRDPVLNPAKWHQLFWASSRICVMANCSGG